MKRGNKEGGFLTLAGSIFCILEALFDDGLRDVFSTVPFEGVGGDLRDDGRVESDREDGVMRMFGTDLLPDLFVCQRSKTIKIIVTGQNFAGKNGHENQNPFKCLDTVYQVGRHKVILKDVVLAFLQV